MLGQNYITLKSFLKKPPEEEESLDEACGDLIMRKPHIIGIVPLSYRVDYDSYLNRKTGKVKTDLFEGLRRITYVYR